MALTFAACQESLDERAAREAKMYTKKNCPAKISETVVMDSMTFLTARAEGGVVVPAKALRFAPDGRPDGRTVFVAGADGAPRPVKVEVLLNNGLDASVKGEGLSVGDRVVTGVTRRSAAKTAAKGAADGESASPFMPKMPRPPKRGAGGPPR